MPGPYDGEGMRIIMSYAGHLSVECKLFVQSSWRIPKVCGATSEVATFIRISLKKTKSIENIYCLHKIYKNVHTFCSLN